MTIIIPHVTSAISHHPPQHEQQPIFPKITFCATTNLKVQILLHMHIIVCDYLLELLILVKHKNPTFRRRFQNFIPIIPILVNLNFTS